MLWGKIEPDLENTNQTAGDGGNGMGTVFAPMGYVSHQLDEKWTVGFGAYGGFGDELEYKNDWAGRYMIQKDTLVGASLVPSVAYKLNDQWSFGLGLNAVYGEVELQLAFANDRPGITCTLGNCPGPDGRIKYSEHEWGFGGNAGVIYAPRDGTRIGFTYTSKVDLDFGGRIGLRGVGGGAVIPERDIRQSLEADVTIPQTATVSLFQQLDSRWALLASANWQENSEFSTIGIKLDELGAQTDADLHWKDTYHGSIGVQYQSSEELLWNAGIGYDTSAVDNSDRIWGLPITDILRGGLGAVWSLDPGTQLHFSYMFSWLGDVKVEEHRNEHLVSSEKIVSGKLPNAYINYFAAGLSMRF